MKAKPTAFTVAHRRLHHQRIGHAAATTPLDVVRTLGAVQAQDYGQALWGIGARVPGSTQASIEASIAKGEILRTWPMRGTIHFVPAVDAHWMLAISAERTMGQVAKRMAELKLTPMMIERNNEIFRKGLADGQRLQREEMFALLTRAGVKLVPEHHYSIIWHAALHGVIGHGPMDGKQPTFVLLDGWVKKPKKLSGDAALVELARRYFTSHGPSTVQDFGWWAGLAMGRAREGLEGAKASLASETFRGKEYWGPTDGGTPDASLAEGVHLLAGFDEFFLGYQGREDVIDLAHAPKVIPGSNGIFRPMIVVDGQVVGTWKKVMKAKSVAIELAPFGKLRATKGEITAAAQRVADFVGLPVSGVVQG
ncbi:MAG: winged helix DNA-binding domain-containing protein [Gemmatimonadota bacterium]